MGQEREIKKRSKGRRGEGTAENSKDESVSPYCANTALRFLTPQYGCNSFRWENFPSSCKQMLNSAIKNFQ